MGEAADTTGGAIGVDVVSHGRIGDSDQWLVTVRFEPEETLEQWRAPQAAAVWRARLENLALEKPRLKIRNGVEVWFSSSAARYANSPPGHKLAILSIVGLYPTVLVLNTLLVPLARGLPERLIAFVSVCILSALITWPIMPLLTRLFHGWLYPSVECLKDS
ncbi:hypothetical protein [Novosphingobium sp.]|uniref:hypothetical protein n=1 Tax=Novosphingobium sp. TaxID=1874826 RepID=UPI002FDEECE7